MWLEQLGYGAKSRFKIVSSRLGFAMRRLENSFIPAVNGYLFQNKERIWQRKEKDGLRLSFAVLKLQWDSNPTAPTIFKL